MTVDQAQRRLALEGAFNFRDLGGYSATDGRMVRWRRVYRADGLDELTDADIATLAAVGLRTVVDLRSLTELRSAPHAFPGWSGIRHVHAPLSVGYEPDPYGASPRPEGLTSESLYRTMVDLGGSAIRTLFEEIAEDQGPLVFHCTAGKDRTGIAAAILLRALGVPDETVTEDYALTQMHMGPLIERIRRTREARGLPAPQAQAMIQATADMLEVALTHLDETHGGTLAYLTRSGVSGATLERVRSLLLESPSGA